MEQLASLQNCLLSKPDDLDLVDAVDVLTYLEKGDGSDHVNHRLLQLTLLQTIFENASTATKLQDLKLFLMDKGIASHLVTLLCDADNFVSYMSVKVLSAVTICSEREEFDDRWYHRMLDIVDQRFKENTSAHLVSHILDYFLRILSCTKFFGIATCLNSLSKRWKSLCKEFLPVDVFRRNCLVLTSFIDLWRKSVKLCQSDMGRYQNEFQIFLLHSFQLPGFVKLILQSNLLRQVLKVINLLLSSGTILASEKCITLKNNELIQKLAERICQEDFICIRFSNRHVGFSGSKCEMPSCSIERETTASFQNLPLLRRYCAVIISASAVLVRNAIATTDLTGDKYISSAIESLHLLERRASEMMVDERPPEMMVDERPPDMMVDERPPDMMVDEQPPEVMTDERQPEMTADERPPEMMAVEQRPEMMADEQRRPWFFCLQSIFEDQDDMWIDILLILLDIYVFLKNSKINLPDLSSTLRDLNPHGLFQQFIRSTSYDHSILVDLLTSPETRFLLYLVKYLKCVVSEWDSFVESHMQSVPFTPGLETFDEMDASEAVKSDPMNVFEYSERAHDRYVEVNREETVDRCSALSAVSLLVIQSTGLTMLSSYDQSDSSNSDDAGMMTVMGKKLCNGQNSDERVNQCRNIDNSQNETVNARQKSPISTSECVVETVSSIAEIKVVLPSVYGATNFRFEEQRKNKSVSCSNENPTLDKHVTNGLDETMTLFIRLRILLEKLNSSGLFPYNVTSLLTLLNKCEDLYEQ